MLASDFSDGSSVETQTYRKGHAHRPMESTIPSSWPGKSAKRVFALDVPAIMNSRRSRDYFTVSAPALQATASWSPVAPLQPTAPMILPPSTSGKPPGDAVGGGESSVVM